MPRTREANVHHPIAATVPRIGAMNQVMKWTIVRGATRGGIVHMSTPTARMTSPGQTRTGQRPSGVSAVLTAEPPCVVVRHWYRSGRPRRNTS